jgi:hypothetical protein
MSQPTYVYEGIIDPGSGAIRLAQLPAESLRYSSGSTVPSPSITAWTRQRSRSRVRRHSTR